MAPLADVAAGSSSHRERCLLAELCLLVIDACWQARPVLRSLHADCAESPGRNVACVFCKWGRMACRCRVACRRDAPTRGFLGHYDLSLIGGSRDVTMKGNRCLNQDFQDFGIAKITDDGQSPVQLVQLR